MFKTQPSIMMGLICRPRPKLFNVSQSSTYVLSAGLEWTSCELTRRSVRFSRYFSTVSKVKKCLLYVNAHRHDYDSYTFLTRSKTLLWIKMRPVALLFFTTSLITQLVLGENPKANEYKSSDCSGPINYPHVSDALFDVTMDDSSHSVYLATCCKVWHAWSSKSEDGGECRGELLGELPGECVNLDTWAHKRIKCVSFSASRPSKL